MTKTAQKMKFSVKDFFSKSEEIVNGKFNFLYSGKCLLVVLETK